METKQIFPEECCQSSTTVPLYYMVRLGCWTRGVDRLDLTVLNSTRRAFGGEVVFHDKPPCLVSLSTDKLFSGQRCECYAARYTYWKEIFIFILTLRQGLFVFFTLFFVRTLCALLFHFRLQLQDCLLVGAVSHRKQAVSMVTDLEHL